MTQLSLMDKPKEFNENTDNWRVLMVLREAKGNWVDRPYRRLSVMWHSRVSDLRHAGHNVECRKVWDAGADRWDHQYRLVQ